MALKNKDLKKEMILDASFRLFMEKGFQNTKIVDIAAAVNMGKSTFYGYFKSKEEIFSELLHDRINLDYLEGWKQITVSGLPAKEKLAKMLLYDISYMDERGHFLRLLYDISQNEQICKDLLAAENFKDIFAVRHAYIRGVVDDGILSGELKNADPELMSIMLTGAFNFFLPAKFGFLPDLKGTLDPMRFLALLLEGIC